MPFQVHFYFPAYLVVVGSLGFTAVFWWTRHAGASGLAVAETRTPTATAAGEEQVDSIAATIAKGDTGGAQLLRLPAETEKPGPGEWWNVALDRQPPPAFSTQHWSKSIPLVQKLFIVNSLKAMGKDLNTFLGLLRAPEPFQIPFVCSAYNQTEPCAAPFMVLDYFFWNPIDDPNLKGFFRP
jgi:hypothetical protein